MKLDECTSQEALGKLYEAVLRVEYRRSTPLNIRQFLGFTVMFLLFPAMVLGFWPGMIATGVFCVLLFGSVFMDCTDWSVIMTVVWLLMGVSALIYITSGVMKHGSLIRSKRRTMRTAEPGNATGVLMPKHHPLNWHKNGKDAPIWKASISLEAPADGIYAFLVEFPYYTGARFGTDGINGCCTVQTAGTKGGPFQALLFYKLAKGRHNLEWRLAVTEGEEKPKALITQINKVEP